MPDGEVRVERSGLEALSEIGALLDAAELPTQGLAARGTTVLLTARVGEAVVGAAAIEHYEPDGLLRSVVVAPSHRGEGIGRRLVSAAQESARAAGLRRLFLLTEGAAAFFGRLGYRTIDRGEVPSGIRESDEYALLCPADAVVMEKHIDG